MKATILVGDVLSRLKDIPSGSVQTCITSPPYWGLRDYGTAVWEGGDIECDHKKDESYILSRNVNSSTLGGGKDSQKNSCRSGESERFCRKCGAVRIDNQIGLEATPQEYVGKMVSVFHEVKRVLRDDGTVFLNLGDSYSGYHGNSRVPDDKAPSNKPGYWENMRPSSVGVRRGVVCGTSDRVPANSLSRGCLCGSLCDVCRVAYRIGKSRNDSLPFPMPTLSPFLPTREHKESERDHPPTSDSSLRVAHTEASTLDSVRAVDRVLVQPPSSLPSMPPQSSLQFQALRSEVSTRDVKCLLCGCSLIDCALESVHKSDGMGDEGDCMGGNASPSVEQENRSRYTCDYCLQIAPYQDYTIQPLPPKNLVGIPWRVAFALQDDGWILRSEIIWCLSGGVFVYARTQKGDMPLMVRDVARLNPETVKLWNGEKWTQVSGWSRSKRRGTEIEIVLRSGERISCTETHQWPTSRGLLTASYLRVGDVLDCTTIPEPIDPMDTETINADAAWLVGLYIAEGSRSEDTIQIAGHIKEEERWEKCHRIAHEWGGYATKTIEGNNMNIRIYGKLLNALVDQFVSGKTAKNKCLATVCWRYSNKWLLSLLNGYLSGDGGWDSENKRWRLGFCRNYNLERDLRALAARLSFHLILNTSFSTFDGRKFPSFRGEIRFTVSGHHNCKSPQEIVEIRKARCREVYDIGVADEPHTYALASGILTHNSKPNPMPESVKDRPTKAHEQIFLLSKSPRYFYDIEAIKEESIVAPGEGGHQRFGNPGGKAEIEYGALVSGDIWYGNGTRNKRSVWTVVTQPFPEAHFATFPEALIEPCILAGTSEHGCCGALVKRLKLRNNLPPEKLEKAAAFLKEKGLV